MTLVKEGITYVRFFIGKRPLESIGKCFRVNTCSILQPICFTFGFLQLLPPPPRCNAYRKGQGRPPSPAGATGASRA